MVVQTARASYTPIHREIVEIEQSQWNCESPSKITDRGSGFVECDGVLGKRQVSEYAPYYGHRANLKKVECVDGTIAHYDAKLKDPDFIVKVASRSGSLASDLAFPEGAVEIEQHYYTGDVVEGHYGEVDKSRYNDDVMYKEVPVYHKEVEEIVKRERVVNSIHERVPVYNYIDTVVDVEKVVEKPIYREVPVKKTVVRSIPVPVVEQRTIEKVRYIPQPEEVEVEKVVEIPGDIVHQVRHVPKDELILTDTHVDSNVPVVVSQVVQPFLKDTKKKVRVPAKTLKPDLYTADVRIPKPVDVEFRVKETETELEWVHLSPEEYNSAFFQLNEHLELDQREALRPNVHLYVDESGRPYMRDENLKFYRLDDTELGGLTNYEPYDFSARPKHRSPSIAASLAPSFISQNDKYNRFDSMVSMVSMASQRSRTVAATPRSPLRGVVSREPSHSRSMMEDVQQHTIEVPKTFEPHDPSTCKYCLGNTPCQIISDQKQIVAVSDGPITYEMCACADHHQPHPRRHSCQVSSIRGSTLKEPVASVRVSAAPSAASSRLVSLNEPRLVSVNEPKPEPEKEIKPRYRKKVHRRKTNEHQPSQAVNEVKQLNSKTSFASFVSSPRIQVATEL